MNERQIICDISGSGVSRSRVIRQFRGGFDKIDGPLSVIYIWGPYYKEGTQNLHGTAYLLLELTRFRDSLSRYIPVKASMYLHES